ncbi:Aste57867_3005 [Aphanomyces stellatus]|uniref:Aste57867_3005 protein n=1 Tax=Aphanomyces stellatus TaxID=120398 RepID=A0A485K9U4_9STRA|nr:hypothetical protein As57867_002996 [Aphanomyces stellatus]VFT80186.1 Aste57867_3005 [Aphanomyces stellatus]
MLALSTLFLATYVAAQPGPNPCAPQIDNAISAAFRTCTTAAGFTNPWSYPQLALLGALHSTTSFVHGDYCAGTFDPACDAFAALPLNPLTNCDYNVYKGQWFNAFKEIPTFCAADVPSTLTVRLSVRSGKALGVTGDAVVVTAPVTADMHPTFDFDFHNHDFQSSDNGQCLTINDDKQLVTTPCDPNDDKTKWSVSQANNTVTHTATGLCVDADPTDDVGIATLQPCNSSPNQYISTYEPLDSPCSASFAYDADFDGEDLSDEIAYGGPESCCSSCQTYVPGCKAYSWADGVCYYKKEAGNAVFKRGVVSATVPSL